MGSIYREHSEGLGCQLFGRVGLWLRARLEGFLGSCVLFNSCFAGMMYGDTPVTLQCASAFSYLLWLLPVS